MTTAQKLLHRKSTIAMVVGILAFLFVLPRLVRALRRVPPPTLSVSKEVVLNRIEISGYIEAAQHQKLESPGEGIVRTVRVQEGDTVKKGQLLFSLENSHQQLYLAEHEFAIEQEEINGVSKKMEIMKLKRNMLQKRLRERYVTAQFDGVVAAFKLSPGQYAKPQDYFGTLIDRSYFKANVEIPEVDASRLKVGQRVEISFPAEPSVKAVGSVTSYPSIARVTSVGRTVVDASIRIDELPEILPGYSFSGAIVAGEQEEILVLKQDGLRYEKGAPLVDRVLPSGKIKSVPVTVEPYVPGFVKIISGLGAGDRVKDQSAARK